MDRKLYELYKVVGLEGWARLRYFEDRNENMVCNERPFAKERTTEMTTENEKVNVVIDLPKQKRKLHVPFTKKNADSETSEKPKNKALHGVYTAGVILLVGGAAAAVATKLKKSETTETSESSSDSTDA